MSLQKTRPTQEALQRIMLSFKQFEKKLDKLQDDVSFHGQTLSNLRELVSNLSAGSLVNPDYKLEDTKRALKRTTAIQYDNINHEQPIRKTRRANAIQPFPARKKSRSIKSDGSRYGLPYNKLNASPNVSPAKHSYKVLRLGKGEAPRKATSLRSGKNLVRNPNKLQKA